jgi:hypothetical protein
MSLTIHLVAGETFKHKGGEAMRRRDRKHKLPAIYEFARRPPHKLPISMPYVNFGAKNCPADRIRWHPNLKLRLLKGILGASPRTRAPILQSGLAGIGMQMPDAARIRCLPHQNNLSLTTTGLAAAMGGALEGRPRQVRIFCIASGGCIAHRTLIFEPQPGQIRMSTSKTRSRS